MHKIEEKNQTHNILLDLKNISLTIDGKKILENISLTLEKGKIKTLIGINGGGKTTLARIIIGALKPSSGKITKQKNVTIRIGGDYKGFPEESQAMTCCNAAWPARCSTSRLDIGAFKALSAKA